MSARVQENGLLAYENFRSASTGQLEARRAIAWKEKQRRKVVKSTLYPTRREMLKCMQRPL